MNRHRIAITVAAGTFAGAIALAPSAGASSAARTAAPQPIPWTGLPSSVAGHIKAVSFAPGSTAGWVTNGSAVAPVGGEPPLQPDSPVTGTPTSPVVGIAATFSGAASYRTVTASGTECNFSVTEDSCSLSPIRLNAPVVGMADDPATGGYWEVAADGGVFSFTAPFHGSMGGQHLNAPVVGMALDPATGGYWLVSSDGGVFSFTAPFYGSMGGQHLNAPVVGMAATPTGGGYWLVTSSGTVDAFGAAPNYGSANPLTPVIGITAVPRPGGRNWYAVSTAVGTTLFGTGQTTLSVPVTSELNGSAR